MMYVNTAECIDCGACEPACPTGAIYYEDDLPADLRIFSESSQSFFEHTGARGGARKAGKLNHDAGPAAELVK